MDADIDMAAQEPSTSRLIKLKPEALVTFKAGWQVLITYYSGYFSLLILLLYQQYQFI